MFCQVCLILVAKVRGLALLKRSGLSFLVAFEVLALIFGWGVAKVVLICHFPSLELGSITMSMCVNVVTVVSTERLCWYVF